MQAWLMQACMVDAGMQNDAVIQLACKGDDLKGSAMHSRRLKLMVRTACLQVASWVEEALWEGASQK